MEKKTKHKYISRNYDQLSEEGSCTLALMLVRINTWISHGVCPCRCLLIDNCAELQSLIDL